MTTAIVISICVATVWLSLLTVLVLAMTRQVSIHEHVLGATARREDIRDVVEDGPADGTAIPPSLMHLSPSGFEDHWHIILASTTCTPCKELVETFSRRPELPEVAPRLVVLAPGPSTGADRFEAVLGPRVKLVRDPEASSAAEDLGISSTPFGITVVDGVIVQSGHVYSPATFIQTVIRNHVDAT